MHWCMKVKKFSRAGRSISKYLSSFQRQQRKTEQDIYIVEDSEIFYSPSVTGILENIY